MSEKKQTIMLGFHSQVDSRLMREWLISPGYKVVESLDNMAGIDLVLMDSVTARSSMDKAFGLKRAAKYFLPVLVCINAGEDVGRWLKAGFDDALRLPATKSEWRARIEIMLRLRRQSEELGQKSEASLIYTLENMSDGFVSLDENWYYTYVNKKAGEMFGRKAEDLVGKHIWTEFPEGIGQPFYKNYYKAVETQKAIFFEDYYQPWDRWFQNRVFPSKKGLSIFFHDITDRKQAEEKLKATNQQLRATEQQLRAANQQLTASEARFKSYIQNAPDGIFIANEKGKYIEVNKAACEITGYSEDELLKLTIPELIQEGYSEKAKNHFQTLVQEGFASGELGFVTKSGEKRFWSVDAVKLSETRFLGFAKDITERKKAEEEVLTLSTAVKQSPSIIALTDTEGKLEYVNPKFREVTGYSQEELIGHNPRILQSGEHSAEMYKELWETILSGKIWQGEFHNKKKNGELFWERASITPIFDEKGKIINYLKDSEDITERKQAEEELRKYREHLEELVNDRTKELQSSNKELEAFAYSVSHDLRAPLRAINGFTRILMEDYVEKLDDEGKRLGSIIQNNAQKMGKLIDDLLAFSRLGRTSMKSSNIDMKNMVHAIYHEASSSAERKRIKFTVADLPDAYGDTNMMRQVWMNLISNAIKFSSKREKAVISISGSQDDEKVTYRISDNGAGFDMQYVNKIFDVFQRLHGDKEYPGTGVGLSLVQRIIHRHNGKVWAESEIDKGATFYFSLPKKRDQ